MKKEVSIENFKKEVIENSILSLVKFKTRWSGACQIIKPVYDELAKTYQGAVQFFSVDIEKEKTLHLEFGVTELPTILFFKGGQLIDHVVGLTSRNILIAKIENALSLN
ncbi:MAG: hypothetical protein ICV66_07365 [Chitinophagaceae bacterium]|nr:hypothetical protein [Chitinophagaceae bacterium]